MVDHKRTRERKESDTLNFLGDASHSEEAGLNTHGGPTAKGWDGYVTEILGKGKTSGCMRRCCKASTAVRHGIGPAPSFSP